MNAIIMAGGEGVRLRPLTCDIPKPLMPLLDTPVMAYSLRLLSRHQINDIHATVCYLPHLIKEAFGTGEQFGCKLSYDEEITPLGTAGSVKKAAGSKKGPFIILSGDGLTDCDLTHALRFHHEMKALVTIILKRVDMPLQYGVVLKNEKNQITDFVEKPLWENVCGRLVNTGLYILEKEIIDMIPSTGKPDFGRDIFPMLLSKNIPIYGCEMPSYWCDIGDIDALLRCQTDLLRGRVNFALPKDRIRDGCYIGEGAVIGENAVIENDTVIGHHARVQTGAHADNACLFPYAVLGTGSTARKSVLCAHARTGVNTKMEEYSALGAQAVLGSGSQLCAGARVWPRRRIASATVTDGCVISGDIVHTALERGAFCLTAPSHAGALVASCVREKNAQEAAVMYFGGEALYYSVIGALLSVGVKAYPSGEGTLPMLRGAQEMLHTKCAFFCTENRLYFLSENGKAPDEKTLDAIERAARRQEYPVPFSKAATAEKTAGAREYYIAKTVSAFSGVNQVPAAVFCPNDYLRKLIKEIFLHGQVKNARVEGMENITLKEGETGFVLSADGTLQAVFTKAAAPSYAVQTLLLCACALHMGMKTLYPPADAPHAVTKMAETKAWDDSAECRLQRELFEDGIFAVPALLSLFSVQPLEDVLKTLPDACLHQEDIPCPDTQKARVMEVFMETKLPVTHSRGVCIRHQSGFATLTPDNTRPILHIRTEADKSETADELCAFYLNAVKKVLNSSAHH